MATLVIYPENYLKDYQKQLADGQLEKTYGKYPLTNALSEQNRSLFVSLAQSTKAFTTDSTGNPTFTVKVPEGQYFYSISRHSNDTFHDIFS